MATVALTVPQQMVDYSFLRCRCHSEITVRKFNGCLLITSGHGRLAAISNGPKVPLN